MRILSWNINGIRTLPQYHPWNTLKSCEEILEHLHADIICFQEMKTSRFSLDKAVALPGSFHSFFSFPVSKGGYSGVAVYANSKTTIPLKAEEGLSGRLQPKPPLSTEERISTSYPVAHEINMMHDEDGNTPSDLVALDSEGRALVLDFGLFVLVNLYCPNETSDARLPFKMNYHLMLQERVQKLVDDGREVIVLGDINICSSPLDHSDGNLASNLSCFYERAPREWFRRWLEPEGRMIDIVRRFWPERKGMYTCWNTKISARETNYGTRVDYILITPGLLPWMKHGDIQPSLKGSDHCPIYIDLHDELLMDNGETRSLQEAMQMSGPEREPPRLAAKFWDELSGKQTLLLNFFGKKANEALVTTVATQPKAIPSAVPVPSLSLSPKEAEWSSKTDDADDITSSPPVPSSSSTSTSSQPVRASGNLSSTAPKRKLLSSEGASRSSTKSKKRKPGQSKLSTYFAKPAASKNTTRTVSCSVEDDTVNTDTANRLLSDHRLALEISSSQIDDSIGSQLTLRSQSQKPSGESKAVWSQLFEPIKPPKCTAHGEPAKELTVNKPGPNKGKNFFICSRPVGPGYDKGRSERLREEVDPQYRCNFFVWSGDVKRESLKTKQ